MIKWLIKKMLPDSKTISKMFAQSAANAINNSGKGDQIAHYTTYAERWDKIQGKLVKWFADGTIDDTETEELANAIEPIVAKILEEIKK